MEFAEGAKDAKSAIKSKSRFPLGPRKLPPKFALEKETLAKSHKSWGNKIQSSGARYFETPVHLRVDCRGRWWDVGVILQPENPMQTVAAEIAINSSSKSLC